MKEKTSRRQFLARSGVAAASLTIVPRYVLGGPGTTPPSELITRGVIGTGAQGMSHVTKYPQTLAVCDVDKNRLANALKKAGGGCDGYGDLPCTLDGRLKERHAVLMVVVDILADHDGVIHDDSERDQEGEHGNHVQADIHGAHEKECAHE